jgi:aminopeptidase
MDRGLASLAIAEGSAFATSHARLLAGYCLDVQPGQHVVIRAGVAAAPLVLALQREVLRRDGWPVLRVALEGQEESWWAAAGDAQLDAFAPLDLLEAESTEATVNVYSPDNATALAQVDPARMARAARARAPVREASLQRRWCVTVWPVPALAQQAGMGTGAFAGLVERALFLDRPDPVAAWRELSDRQARLIERLAPAREIRIEAPGTDLTLDVEGRTWINSDGRRNMPSGEVFTGPHETSANGTVRFTVPTAHGGVDVAGVELRFEDGVVVDARAERGHEYLLQTLETDDGARRLGELGVGTNTGIQARTGMILLDEKIGGTIHLALGRSYPETGGLNDSAIHWDLICDLRTGGRLLADGLPVDPLSA